jgi:aminomethyltransferase
MTTSPLHQFNLDHGARLVDFGGWEMPVQYESVLVEHRAVREESGFFDVSHLGRFSLTGPGAAAALDRLLCNNLERISPGQAQYTMMLNAAGGVVDDIILWWWSEGDYWIMPNAANQPRVMAAFSAEPGCQVINLQTATAMLAIQGPDAPGVFESVLENTPRRFRTHRFQWGGGPVWMAGTGYTGERGGELVTDPATARLIAQALIRAGVRPCGLGSRDTLRLEAGFPLWGQDLDETTTPLEADLGFAVDMDHDFVGRKALEAQRESGLPRKLTGFVMRDRGVPRHGYQVRGQGAAGTVTSGNISPVLETGIGMAYLAPPLESDSGDLEVEIRSRWVAAEAKKPPFHGPVPS